MNYNETIDYLFSQLPVYQKVGGSAYKEGLGNSLALDAHFGHPHTKYKTIHVAGTNGKGSTSNLLAAVLQKAGYKVGLYTSPHLVDFRERIRVNGQMIDKDYVVKFVDENRSFFEPIHPSFFELTMMMAFQYFADEKVDVAVVEVGLGGRLDSTNIISPVLSIITNISFDHTQFLGDTLSKIAMEKAGIIKKDIPVVVGEAEGEVRNVFQLTADVVGTSIVFAEDNKRVISVDKTVNPWVFNTKEYPELKSGLIGEFQVKNVNTVLASIDKLNEIGFALTKESVYRGFSDVTTITGLQGRWHILSQSPKVICDTGHNVAGVSDVVRQLNNESFDHLHIVIGMVNDKDISHVLSLLPHENVSYYFTQASISRALNADELANQASHFKLSGEVFYTVREAVGAALDRAEIGDLVFIGGSNFIVGEALPLFEGN